MAAEVEGDAAAPETPGAGEPEPEPDRSGRATHTIYKTVQRSLRVEGQRFGERVREIRRTRGWTLKDLARYSGVPITTLSDLENGASRNPEPALTLTLAAAFGCTSPAAMLGDQVDPVGRKSVVPPEATAAAAQGVDGPGPMTLAGLIEGLLRGVWAAQDAHPGGAPQNEPGASATSDAGGGAKHSILEEHVARATEVLRAGQPGGAPVTNHPILAVGVVVLNEPRTLG